MIPPRTADGPAPCLPDAQPPRKHIVTDTAPDIARFDPVWRATEPYLRARKNDIHVPLSFDWCQRLLEHYPEACRDVCSLAIILHDIGWHAIDMERILAEGFRGENTLQSDVRYLHETEGVRLAKPILADTGFGHLTDQVCEIIDGHDTRPEPRHLNDSIVRDADKLWRFEPAAVGIVADWRQMTPSAYCHRLRTKVLPQLETEAARAMALPELERTCRRLMVRVL